VTRRVDRIEPRRLCARGEPDLPPTIAENPTSGFAIVLRSAEVAHSATTRGAARDSVCSRIAPGCFVDGRRPDDLR
jgi:hypothetical protein